MARKKKNGEDEDAELDAVPQATGVRLSAHPRARRHISRTKGWFGMFAFGATAYFSLRAGLELPDVLLRALLAGIAGVLVGWALALTVWRHIALAQIEDLRKTLIEEMEQRQRAREEQAERERAEQAILDEAEAARARAPDGAFQG